MKLYSGVMSKNASNWRSYVILVVVGFAFRLTECTGYQETSAIDTSDLYPPYVNDSFISDVMTEFYKNQTSETAKHQDELKGIENKSDSDALTKKIDESGVEIDVVFVKFHHNFSNSGDSNFNSNVTNVSTSINGSISSVRSSNNMNQFNKTAPQTDLHESNVNRGVEVSLDILPISSTSNTNSSQKHKSNRYNTKLVNVASLNNAGASGDVVEAVNHNLLSEEHQIHWKPYNVPLQRGSFDMTLTREDFFSNRHYLLSVLVPIGIGVTGATVIVIVAYLLRSYRRKKRLRMVASASRNLLTSHYPDYPQMDNAMLLDETSDDGF